MYNILQLDNIRQEHLFLLSCIEFAEGELTPEIEQALQINQDALQEQAISIGHLVHSIEYNRDAIENEMQRLKKMRDRAETAIDLLKERIAAAMNQYGVQAINSPTLNIFFRKSVGVKIHDITLLPSDFYKFPPPKPDLTLIKDAIHKGEVVPGAEMENRRNIQIK